MPSLIASSQITRYSYEYPQNGEHRTEWVQKQAINADAKSSDVEKTHKPEAPSLCTTSVATVEPDPGVSREGRISSNSERLMNRNGVNVTTSPSASPVATMT